MTTDKQNHKLSWKIHATIFVSGIVLVFVWIIFLAAIFTSVILTGQKMEGIPAFIFLLLGIYAATATLYELPNLHSGYLYSLGKSE